MLERRISIAALGTIAALILVLSDASNPAQADTLINNNVGATGTSHFTQSSATLLVFDNTVLGVFNDSGSFSGGANHFTGFSRSTDGGVTFTDMGTFPASAAGDAGFPVLARDSTSGTVYMGALPFDFSTGYQMLRSVDGGVTFGPAINSTPGRTQLDVTSIAVDNFAGPTRGNVYVATRSFDSGNGIFLFRSTDGGATWGPSGGIQLASITTQGPRLAVGPDHAVYVTWLDGGGPINSLQMKKSTDGGLTFAPPVTVATLAPAGLEGDLGLTGIRNGTTAAAAFGSNTFPNIAVNPVTGHIYVVFADNPPGTDKADVFFTVSTDNGLTWAPRVRANDDLTTSDQWMPTLAVTPDGSSLGIFWYDRRLDPVLNPNLIDYFGSICDTSAGAPTCGANFRISDVSFLPEFGRDSPVSPTYMGDWDVAQADNSFFYVGWGDNRLPLSGGGSRMDPNVFFDRIAVPGVQAVPEPGTLLIVSLGAAALAALHKRRGRAKVVRRPHA
jgi:hypothetical protein